MSPYLSKIINKPPQNISFVTEDDIAMGFGMLTAIVTLTDHTRPITINVSSTVQ